MRVVLVQAKHVNYGIAIEVRDKVVLPPLGRMVKCGVVVVLQDRICENSPDTHGRPECKSAEALRPLRPEA